MIEPIPFAGGFLIYVMFCLVTFDIYSKNKGMLQAPILFFIYFYYSFLVWYVINLIENGDNSFMLVLIEFLAYLIPCGIIMWNYYIKKIKPQDEGLYGQNV